MFGLDKSMRLIGKNRFNRVFRSRRVRANRLFLIHYATTLKAEDPVARLGIAVSRKVHASAVERNRIRRQIRESFRLRRRQLRPNDYVVRARPAAADADNPVLRQALTELWEWFEVK